MIIKDFGCLKVYCWLIYNDSVNLYDEKGYETLPYSPSFPLESEMSYGQTTYVTHLLFKY